MLKRKRRPGVTRGAQTPPHRRKIPPQARHRRAGPAIMRGSRDGVLIHQAVRAGSCTVDYPISLDRPSYLVLLLLLPVLWYIGRSSLSAMSTARRYVALALRSAVFIALVLALAEVRFVQPRDRLAVVYV